MVCDLIEDSIDEGSGVLRAESLPNVDGLIDGHFWRDVLGAEELIDSYPKNAPVDPRHAAYPPVFCVAFDEPIDLITTFYDAPHQIFTKVSRFLVEGEMIPEEVESLIGTTTGDIDLVKNLEGRLPPSSPSAQILPNTAPEARPQSSSVRSSPRYFREPTGLMKP